MNQQIIALAAGYEKRLIRRSFLFRVLCLAVLGGITFLQWMMQCKEGQQWQQQWLFSWQSFSFPLVNAYLYNVVQAFLLLFVATDVFDRERQNGPQEALRVRPAGNGEWLIGKALGIVMIFLPVGFVSLLASAGLNLFESEAPFDARYYLFYFLTLTVPSLVFFTGFALWISWITRSRVLALFLLLVYWFVSVTVLPGVFHGALDFSGSGLSNVFSVTTGHVDGRNYALHRLAYLLAGAGFICWTVRLQRRLPNDRRAPACFLSAGVALLLAGIMTGGLFANVFWREEVVRKDYRAAFSRHAGVKSCRVTRHDITLEQRGSRLRSTSNLTLRNPNKETVSRPVLYLNPGLAVERVEEAGKPLPFERDGQVIVVKRPLDAGDSARLTLRYAGKIDERVAYLDLEDASYYDTRRGNNFFHLGRRHGLVGDEAVVLVPELLWYPVAVAPVNTDSPALTGRDYTRYRLRVVHPVQRVVVSQGERHHRGDTLEFRPARPLEGITLCAGNYERSTFEVQGIHVALYYSPKSDFLSPLVKDMDPKILLEKVGIKLMGHLGYRNNYGDDTKLVEIIQRQDWFSGGKGNLLLVEAPLPFVSHARSWKGRSENVQPGLILWGERGIAMPCEYVFCRLAQLTKKDLEKLHESLGRLVYPLFTKRRYRFWQNPFLSKFQLYEAETGIDWEPDPFNGTWLIKEPSITITSNRYGAIDQILKLLLSKDFRNINKSDLDYYELDALTYLQNATLEEALQDRTIRPLVLDEIIELKTLDLYHRLEKYQMGDDFVGMLRDFCSTHYGEVPLDSLVVFIQTKSGLDFDTLLQEWHSREIPDFRLRNIVFANTGGFGHRLQFKVLNTGKIPATIRCTNPLGNKEVITIQPGACKQVCLRINSSNAALHLGLSRHIPQTITFDNNRLRRKTQDTSQGIWDIPPHKFYPKEEILIDNEHEGFRLILPTTKWLQRYLSNEVRYNEGYKGTARVMNRWGKIYAGDCHGEQIRSAYLKTAGRGSFKAEWTTDIPKKGRYEIFVWVPSVSYYGAKRQYYTVHGEGMKPEEILLPLQAGRWTSLGQFDLQRGKSTVMLDDRVLQERKGEGKTKRPALVSSQYIVADAVKWVEIK